MIKIIYLPVILLFLGCSFKSPPNEWQYKSINAFDAYTKDFLSSNDKMARNDLNRAIKHAKMSADLTTLAKVYLGKCALNISVGIDDRCSEYKSISELVDNTKLDAYYNLVSLNLDRLQPDKLDKNYQKFALYLVKKDMPQAKKALLDINKPTSKLLAAALIKDNLDNKTRKEMLDSASFLGYKKSVLFWLNELKVHTKDTNKLKKIRKKIEVIKSK